MPTPPQNPLQVNKRSQVRDGKIVGRVPIPPQPYGAQVRVQSNISIDYAFEGSKTADGKSIKPSIDSMIAETSRAITLLEPEFTQFGISQFK